jgi:hypothetical protein
MSQKNVVGKILALDGVGLHAYIVDSVCSYGRQGDF